MEISQASEEDRRGIYRLYEQFNQDREESGAGRLGFKYLDGDSPWAEELTDDECVTLVAREKNIVLGFITIRIPRFNPFRKIKKLGEVDLIVVERKLRRRSIGTNLFKKAVKLLKGKHVSHVLLNVKVGNKAAHSFWKKMKFKPMTESIYERKDGVEEGLIYMIKKI
ncbi:MAG: GNAT family N-acetyltransferase [Candidatus Altiarchaeales archaeon]|nr:GNAT family N-acetyltransferase [Candidatus Altiarchaeales archaeon]MBD3416380.1 GNAT family N-acetyltransferase [Candidatus Altiarchaeales archaeon]